MAQNSSQLLKTMSGGGRSTIVPELPDFPPLPDDVKKRFPSLVEWEKKFLQYEKQKAQRRMS